MALTYTEVHRSVHGMQRVWEGLITFDNSYPTGGEVIDPAQLGMSTVESVSLTPTAGTRLFSWNQTTRAIQVFTALSTEAANASDQSTISIRVLAFGR